MRPPWIIIKSLLLLFANISSVVTDAERNEGDNSTTSRLQRGIYERERRLIPYTTYYLTQSLPSLNIGARNVFIPIKTSTENNFQGDPTSKTPLNNIQNGNLQEIEILKPVVRPTSLSILAPKIQGGLPREKEDGGVFPYVYRLESGVIRAQIQPETQPFQVVKVNPEPTEQKYTAPQFIKIVPVVSKLPLENKSAKAFISPQPQLSYSREKPLAFTPDSHTVNYYKEPIPLNNENSYHGNKLYAGHFLQGNAQLRLIGPTPRPDANKYTIAKIVFSTTPSPYANIKFNANDGRSSEAESNAGHASISQLSQLNPALAEYNQERVVSTESSFAATPSQQQLYYAQNGNRYQSQGAQDLIQHQNAEHVPQLRVPLEEKIRFVATVTPVTIANDLESVQQKMHDKEQKEKIYGQQPLRDIFSLLKETKKLPQNLTPDNIDTSIKTLALILERLQQQKNYQDAQKTLASGSSTLRAPALTVRKEHRKPSKIHSFPEKSGTSTPGRPGVDYPIYSSIPQTNFDCSTQRYKGFFGDPDTNCQVWHYCDLNGGQASFLCPNGTIFSQVALTCDWWFNVKCASTSQLYVLNERLYKYILPFSPSFPEDYSGPIVDTYLAAKFKEMEAKTKLKAMKSLASPKTTMKSEMTTEEEPTETTTQSLEEYRESSHEEQ